ncbi:UbiA prenyltransferase family protein [uncultured archaeon]|nr:UbiA prenyltransferase family protein [uncultured archaeon]
MYAAVTHSMNHTILLIASGFMLIHLFGDCFNDYYDVKDDLRNGRQDKLILSGVISAKRLYNLSILILVLGLSFVALADTAMFLPALWYSVLLFSYSHPSIRLKKYDLVAYLLGGSVWIFTFLFLDMGLFGRISFLGTVFALFSFSQFVFILCQKDITDNKDSTNLFLSKGRINSLRITVFFGMLSSLSLLILSTTPPFFIFIWVANLLSKSLLLNKIRLNSITRQYRSRLVFVEFLTPYFYIGGNILA